MIPFLFPLFSSVYLQPLECEQIITNSTIQKIQIGETWCYLYINYGGKIRISVRVCDILFRISMSKRESMSKTVYTFCVNTYNRDSPSEGKELRYFSVDVKVINKDILKH